MLTEVAVSNKGDYLLFPFVDVVEYVLLPQRRNEHHEQVVDEVDKRDDGDED